MKIVDYLNAAKAKLRTDSAVGRAIGKRYSDIWAYRNKGITPDAETCTKLALVLDVEPMEIISAAGIESSKTERSREFWQGFHWQLKGAGTSTDQPRFSDSCDSGDTATAGEKKSEEVDDKTKSPIIRSQPQIQKSPLRGFFIVYRARIPLHLYPTIQTREKRRINA